MENQIISTIKQKFQKSMEKKEKTDKRKKQAIENHLKYLKQTEFAHVFVELMEQGKALTIENLLTIIEEKTKLSKIYVKTPTAFY